MHAQDKQLSPNSVILGLITLFLVLPLGGVALVAFDKERQEQRSVIREAESAKSQPAADAIKKDVEQQVQTMSAVTNAAIVVAVDYLQEIGATLERQSISVENDLAFIPHVIHEGKTCTLILSRLPQLAAPPIEPGWQVKTLDCSTPQRPHD